MHGMPDRRTVTAAILSPCVSSLPMMLVGATSVQLAGDLHVNPATLGILATSYFLASAAFSFAASHAVETRLGAGRSMRLAATCSAVALVGVATITNRWVAIPFLALGGLANAMAQPAANLLLARRVPEGRQGFYFAVKQSAIIGASMLAGLSVPTLVVQFGWRWAFLAAAVLALLTVFVVPGQIPGAGRSEVPNGTVRLALRGPIIVMAASITLGTAAVAPLPAFLVAASVDTGIPEATAGLLLALASLCGLSMRLLSGRVVDAVGGEPLKGVTAMLLVGSAGLAMMASGSPLFVVGAFVAFTFGWGWPGLFQFGVVRHNRDLPSIATGVTQTGVYLGGVVGPSVYGAVAKGVGFGTAWMLVAGLMSASAVGIAIGSRMAAGASEGRGVQEVGEIG